MCMGGKSAPPPPPAAPPPPPAQNLADQEGTRARQAAAARQKRSGFGATNLTKNSLEGTPSPSAKPTLGG